MTVELHPARETRDRDRVLVARTQHCAAGASRALCEVVHGGGLDRE